MPPIDDGSAVHYTAVQRGVPVYGSDEVEVGKVDEVLDNYREHIFDGIVMETPDGVLRFVDAPEVARTAERGVTLNIPSSEAAERSHEFEVDDRLLTDVGGTIGARVLSSPGMIAMMERTAAILSFEGLPEGKATVGFEVCVKHVAAAAEGANCTAHARLRDVVDGRKLPLRRSRCARAIG